MNPKPITSYPLKTGYFVVLKKSWKRGRWNNLATNKFVQ